MYAGATWAPFQTLQHDGLRLRLAGTQGAYRTTATYADPVTNSTQSVRLDGAIRTAELLVGYQWSQGAWTLKAFVGPQWLDHRISLDDPAGLWDVGSRVGAKAALEVWLNLGASAWASLDLTYATAMETHAHRLRVAARLNEQWSLGSELRLLGTIDEPTWRAGAFLRFDNGVTEVSAAVGHSRSALTSGDLYGTLQWARRF
jgi:hypothetical protein